jgi:hypothetical protein
MEGKISTPSGILSFGPNLLGVQVYAIIRYVGQYPIFVRKASVSEVEEAFKK